MATLLDTVRDLGRLRQIANVLIRHGFGEVVQQTGLGPLVTGEVVAEGESRLGARIREALTELGPSFVKLGQILSTRPDLIPAEIVDELRALQDRVAPISLPEVRAQVQHELGAPVEDIYESFEEEPLASASIAQVHRAVLQTDEGPADVVVKVQRPEIRETIERDIDLLYWLARALERSVPESRIYQPVRLVTEYDQAIHAELDFTLEADHAERFRQNFVGEASIRFPVVHRRASARRVLTLEYFGGHKLYEAIDAGFSAEKICKAALGLMLKAVFEDGFFHADPHPGNLILLGTSEAPVLGVVDLGLVGRLTPQLRDRTIDLMIAAVQEDYRGIADALYAIGTPTHRIDRDDFEAEVRLVAERYLRKRLRDIEPSRLIQDLVQGARRYGLEIPADFLLVGKALMTVEGVGREIYPDLDLFDEMKPYFLRLMWARYSPDKVATDLVRTMGRIGGAASDLPMQSKEILEDLRRGRLEIRTHEPTLRVAADLLGRRLFSGLVVSSMVVGAAVLVAGGSLGAGLTFLSAAGAWAALHLRASERGGGPPRRP